MLYLYCLVALVTNIRHLGYIDKHKNYKTTFYLRLKKACIFNAFKPFVLHSRTYFSIVFICFSPKSIDLHSFITYLIYNSYLLIIGTVNRYSTACLTVL